MSSSPIKVGVVGCGRIVRLAHLPALLSLPGVEVSAVADCDAVAREAARAGAPGASAHADYRELFAESDAEAVLICLPSALHAEAADAALEAGKHVYLEKPLAISLEEGRALVRAWRRSGRVGMVGLNFRCGRVYEQARRLIRGGALGELVGARTVFSTGGKSHAAWKRERRTGGGVLLDLASHHFDLARFMFGREIESVSARVRSLRGEADAAAVQLALEGGALVQSFFSSCAVEEDRFEVYGTRARLAVDRHLALVERDEAGRGATRVRRLARGARALVRGPHALAKTLRPAFEPSYRDALARFFGAVRAGEDAAPNFEDGFRSLAAALAAEESARDGRAVTPARLDD